MCRLSQRQGPRDWGGGWGTVAIWGHAIWRPQETMVPARAQRQLSKNMGGQGEGKEEPVTRIVVTVMYYIIITEGL